MRSVIARVPAKINLVLEVGPARADGYHDLSTVYHAISIYDEVMATSTDGDEIEIRVVDTATQQAHSQVPCDAGNLAVRAARLLAERTDRPSAGVDLLIHKSIPVAGGLAGGSADAAAALVACNELWEAGLSRPELEEIAAELGSDVPFLISGATAIGSGRGESIMPALTRGAYHWVVVTFAEGMSTPEVYAEFDRLGGNDGEIGQATRRSLEALSSGDPGQLAPTLWNDLDEAALSLRPQLMDALDAGEQAFTLGGLISGSGPSVFFLASDQVSAEASASQLEDLGIGDSVLIAHGPVPGARIISS